MHFSKQIYWHHYLREKEAMLYTIVVVLAVLWLLGMIGNIGGSLIHLLLVAAVVVLIYNLFVGRRSPTV